MCKVKKSYPYNSVSFLPIFNKKVTLEGPTFLGTFFSQKHGKNSVVIAKKRGRFTKIDQKQSLPC